MSQHWQYPGTAEPQPATISAAERHIRRHQAPFSDGSEVPSNQRVSAAYAELIRGHWRGWPPFRA